MRRRRLRNIIPISGLHDLRPLMKTEMNATLCLERRRSLRKARLSCGLPGQRVGCWVGEQRKARIPRQSRLLSNMWTGLGASAGDWAEPNKHHFNILDGLLDPNHPLTMALVSANSRDIHQVCRFSHVHSLYGAAFGQGRGGQSARSPRRFLRSLGVIARISFGPALSLQSGFEMDVLSYLEMPASPNVTTSIPRINTASRHSSSSG